MYTDYLFYLNALAEAERTRQILTIILIWIAILAIGGTCTFLKNKSKKIFNE